MKIKRVKLQAVGKIEVRDIKPAIYVDKNGIEYVEIYEGSHFHNGVKFFTNVLYRGENLAVFDVKIGSGYRGYTERYIIDTNTEKNLRYNSWSKLSNKDQTKLKNSKNANLFGKTRKEIAREREIAARPAIGYKVLAIHDDGRLSSLYNHYYYYTIGHEYTDNHFGLFAYESLDACRESFIRDNIVHSRKMEQLRSLGVEYAICEVTTSGSKKIVCSVEGKRKYSSPKLTVNRIIETYDKNKNLQKTLEDYETIFSDDCPVSSGHFNKPIYTTRKGKIFGAWYACFNGDVCHMSGLLLSNFSTPQKALVVAENLNKQYPDINDTHE